MKRIFYILLIALVPLLVEGQDAIPGAVGFGKSTRGAYAGSSTPTILYVDTLIDASYNSDATHGSFRWAALQTYPRIILLEVSGVIEMDSDIQLASQHSYVTIYGQTAPGKGLVLRCNGGNFRSYANEVIIQHLRFEGDSVESDPFGIYGGKNHYLDHISSRYAQDENISLSPNPEGHSTIANCLSSEPFYYGSYDGGYGMLIGGEYIDSVTVYRNLVAHAAYRPPLINGNTLTRADVINNYYYNPIRGSYQFRRPVSGISTNMTGNLVGNYLKYGPNSDSTSDNKAALGYIHSNVESGTFYIYNNWSRNQTPGSWWSDIDIGTGDSTDYYSATPNYGDTYSIIEPENLFDTLNAKVGAFWWNRDTIDKRILYEVATKTGEIIDNTGAEPYFTEQKYRTDVDTQSVTLSVPSSPHTVSTGGYTYIELWADSLANPDVESPSGGGSITDYLTFTTNTGLTEVAINQYSGSGTTAWAYHGLADQTLTGDGKIWWEVDADSIKTMLGFNTSQTDEGYTNWEYGVYTSSTTLVRTITDGGIANIADATVADGDYIGLERRNDSIFVTQSTNRGADWVELHSFTTVSSGTLYINCNVENDQARIKYSSISTGDVGVSISLDLDSTNVTCNGGSDGTITTTVIGGTSPFTFAWDDGPTTQNRTGLNAGWYTVTVTDANDSTATDSIQVLDGYSIEISYTKSNLPNSSIDITVTGGTEPYTYLWNDGPTTEDRTDISTGTYSVTVTDANGCTSTSDNITIIDRRYNRKANVSGGKVYTINGKAI